MSFPSESLFSFKQVLRAAVFAALLPLPVAQAQDQRPNIEPRSLTPRTLAPRPAPEATPAPALRPEQRQTDGISIQPLQSINPEAVGTLSAADSLPSSLWDKAKRTQVEARLLSRQSTTPYPSITALETRLILSASEPPRGQSDQPFSVVRLRTLMQQGAFEAAQSLLVQLPQSSRTPAHLQAEHDLYLLSGDYAKACAISASQSEATDYYWVKSFAFCRMLAGQQDLARLSLSLLRDFGDEDPAYYALMEALPLDQSHRLDQVPWDRPLILALLATTLSPLPPYEGTGPAPALRTHFLAQRQNIDALLRQAKAEPLVKALEALEFSAEDRAQALDALDQLGPDKGHAFLYQLAYQSDQLPVIQAEAIAAAIRLAIDTRSRQGLATLYAPLVEGLAPSLDLQWFAPHALDLLLRTARVEQAAPWFQLLAARDNDDAEANQAYDYFLPLALLEGWVPPASLEWSSLLDRSNNMPDMVNSFLILDQYQPYIPLDILPALTQNAGPAYNLNAAHRLGRYTQAGAMGLSLLEIGDQARQTSPFAAAIWAQTLSNFGLEAEAHALIRDILISLLPSQPPA